MKKSLKTLSILMAALAIGSFAGCKTEVAAGGKFSSVSSVDKNETTGAKTVVIDLTSKNKDLEKRFNADIEWFAWTKGDAKERRAIVSDVTVYKNEKKDTNKVTGTKLQKGNKYIFEFKDAGKYNFYMYQKQDKTAGVNENDKDAVGVITVDEKYPVKIHMNDSGWKFVDQNGVFAITNNEPGDLAFFYEGDYTITELWPLVKMEGKDNLYAVDNDLKYMDLEIKKNQSAAFLFPAGKDLLVTTRQPKRATEPKKATEYRYVIKDADKTGGYSGTWGPEGAKKLVTKTSYPTGNKSELASQDLIDLKNNEYWAFELKFEPHKTISKNSSATTVVFNKDKKKDEFTKPSTTKAAAMTTVEVYEIDPTVSSEK